MSKAALSVLVFGGYMLGQGALMLAAPNVLLSLLQLGEASELWPRAVGIALIVLGLYYVLAAQGEWVPFFKATLIGRTVQLVCFVGLVVTGIAPLILLATSGLEFGSALWTWWALKSDQGGATS